ncbi:DUF2997 domain-containing protein [Gloeobacter violaceus]|uniref:Gsl2882 protein n=1 Tax=Gloeobacter violaceus (strain ATCC 29082 / PCC 7421) TaxID=251221 RepID=Q7NCU4_GLOVI|nr:DUF2997 domain-containing protein [Gloeobacter violaceus]BAC90823.1 gsl2882 [Gloeobacter violaceus PCC 7421]
MEQIEFIVHSDGRVEERVTGVAGSRCSELTRSIEQALGPVQHVQPTSEYFQQSNIAQPLWNTSQTH